MNDLSNTMYFWNRTLPYAKPYQGPHREESYVSDGTTTSVRFPAAWTLPALGWHPEFNPTYPNLRYDWDDALPYPFPAIWRAMRGGGRRHTTVSSPASCHHSEYPEQVYPNQIIPGHALHEKGLQGQIGDGTLVSSQERRALAVLVINRLSNAGQTLISFPHRFT